MKKILLALLCLAIVVFIGVLTFPKDLFRSYPQLNKKVAADEAQVVLHTTEGNISLKLFPKQAPLAAENFLTHSKNGYYDGLTFHRVIADFMIQSGDPKGTGQGGQSIWAGKNKKIDSGKGFTNEISSELFNIRGSLAMANSGPDTNGSQFYINQNPQDQSQTLNKETYPKAIVKAYAKGGNPNLDGSYTVFGQVISGMKVVDKIAKAETDSKGKPKKSIKIKKVEVVKDYKFK